MLETQLHFISAVLILLAAIVPIYLTIKLKDNLKKLTAILSIFIIIWIVGDMVSILHDNGIVGFSALQSDLGAGIHVVSMVFFSMMLWLRYYYSERSSKKMIEDLQLPDS